MNTAFIITGILLLKKNGYIIFICVIQDVLAQCRLLYIIRIVPIFLNGCIGFCPFS
ncbi:hypothetical protein C1645_751419 [Glomus cerebriforme]|uniref:Uncharacterized protein n=1 Tax=Glomus cerebriforme TaxID=658196 RepID=A0A397TKH3_9GLOM|nr:hypothetical protein C1645_751419 [Glomus cerebriforme]